MYAEIQGPLLETSKLKNTLHLISAQLSSEFYGNSFLSLSYENSNTENNMDMMLESLMQILLLLTGKLNLSQD